MSKTNDEKLVVVAMLALLTGVLVATSGGARKQTTRTPDLMSATVRRYRTHPGLRKLVGALIAQINPRKRIDRIRRIFEFVADRIAFVNDPGGEYVATPIEVLTTRVGDCDCKCTLLASLLEAAGYATRFIFIPGHVYVEVLIELQDRDTVPVGAYTSDENGKVWLCLEPTAPNQPMGWLNISSVSEAFIAHQMNVVDNA